MSQTIYNLDNHIIIRNLIKDFDNDNNYREKIIHFIFILFGKYITKLKLLLKQHSLYPNIKSTIIDLTNIIIDFYSASIHDRRIFISLFARHTRFILDLFYNDPLYSNILSIIVHLNDVMIDFIDI